MLRGYRDKTVFYIQAGQYRGKDQENRQTIVIQCEKHYLKDLLQTSPCKLAIHCKPKSENSLEEISLTIKVWDISSRFKNYRTVILCICKDPCNKGWDNIHSNISSSLQLYGKWIFFFYIHYSTSEHAGNLSEHWPSSRWNTPASCKGSV